MFSFKLSKLFAYITVLNFSLKDHILLFIPFWIQENKYSDSPIPNCPKSALQDGYVPCPLSKCLTYWLDFLFPDGTYCHLKPPITGIHIISESPVNLNLSQSFWKFMLVCPKVTRIHKQLGSNTICTTYNKPDTALDTKDINTIKVTFVIEGLHSSGVSWKVWESI